MFDINKPFIFTVLFANSDFLCKSFSTEDEANEAMTSFLDSNTRPTVKVAVEQIF